MDVNLKVSDLAGIYAEMAEEIGIENTYALYKRFHGLQLVFPQKFCSNECIVQKMRKEYEEGESVRDIARRFGYSESRVHQILKEKEKRKMK